MKNYIFKNKKFIILLSLGTLITSVIVLLVPILITIFKLGDSTIFNYHIIIVISLSMILSLLIQHILIVFREKISVGMNVDNSLELYDRMFKLKYSNLTKLGPSYLLDRISMTVNALYLFVCTTLTTIITNVIISIVCILIVFYYNIYLGLLLFLVVPVNYFGYKKLNKNLQKKSIFMQKTTSSGYQNILALINNTDFIKQYSSFPYTKKYLKENLSNIFNSIKEVNVFAQTMSNLLRFVNIYVQNITIFIISYDVLKNQLGVTPVIVVSIILPIFFNSVSEITRANINAHDIRSGLKFINDDLGVDRLEISGEKILETVDNIVITKNNISQNNINFVIDGDLYFKKGDIVYISGASGVGKSTLLKSIAGLYENDFVLYNNQYLKELDIDLLKRKVLYVAQETTILPISLEENLKIGNIKNSEKLEVKGIDNNRLSEKIYEAGKNLSGGEKQRIALARALYTKSDVLLLDEVTSNIDEKSTKFIYEEIILSSKKCIIFITSHDESVRSICNKEVVVKRGKKT